MRKFMLFVIGLIALLVLIANIGPMILLGVSIWLLYVIFKQFVKSDSTGSKIGWTLVGLLVLSIAISNIYAILGIVAAYGLYLIIKSWKRNDKESTEQVRESDDPFMNFERQWEELNTY